MDSAPAGQAGAIVELRRQIADMDQRILRQRKRIDRILATTFGPATAMQAVLDDMTEARAALQARLENLERAPRANADGDASAKAPDPSD
jgi:hypothetical protein